MIRSITAAAAFALAATPALGQGAAGPAAGPPDNKAKSEWSGNVEISTGARIGRKNPFDTTEDLIDESEHELALSGKVTHPIWDLPLTVKGGITWSPQQFNDEDPESGLYGELTLGDDYHPIHKLGRFEQAGDADDDVLDAMRPFGSVRYTRVYRSPLDGFVRDEEQVTLGIRYRNVVSIMCERRMGRGQSAEAVGACVDAEGKSTAGISWELRAQVTRIWSSQAEEERLAPSVRADVVSQLIGRSLRFFVRGQYELQFYDHAMVASTGREREDRRLRLGAGIDLSDWATRRLKGAGLELEAQYQRRWSNDADRRHERFYIVPTVSFSYGY
ncbi:MAG TPA: hypothetical protein VGC35_13370 [Allosphingosinicella sp.]|jgi:hypothetical protein